MKFAKVALDVPLPRLFDYEADDLAASDIGARVLVPFGNARAPNAGSVGVIMDVSASSEVPRERLKPVIRILRDTPPLPGEWLTLVRFCATYYHKPVGEVVAAALPPRLRTGKPAPEAAALFELARPAQDLLEEIPARSKARRSFIESWKAATYDDVAVAALPAPQKAVFRAMLKSGEILRRTPTKSTPLFRILHPLTGEQEAIVDDVAKRLGLFSVQVLFGITGSGKTEIYLHLIAKALAQGRQALVLVPEIALTPALQAAFSSRFPGARIVMQHSAMPEMERARAWLEAQQGMADIVLGTRLAAFVPMANPGIIVVDEEQDASFKQQEGLRYNARDLAIFRARSFGIPVILSSATPSLETYHHAMKGRYQLHQLTARAHARAALPRVHIVDTGRYPARHGLSEPVIEALAARLARAEQSLIFLNRRGYAPVLACSACAWISDCPDCTAHLVVHLAERRLRCHHCGHAVPVPRACPTCGNVDLHPIGRGTQRLEDTLNEQFPDARVLRIDGDSTRRRGSLEAMLEEVRSGQANILVGTQILAKGHHFERLTLVAILNSDAALFAADYRASERLFAQLEQVAGRAGRENLPGEVWIQTRFPAHPLYQALREHDFQGFAQALLKEREHAGFPPFVHEAALRAEAEKVQAAQAFLDEAMQRAPQEQARITLFKPVPLAMPRLASMERVQLIMQSPSRAHLQAFLTEWMAKLHQMRPRGGVRWHIDVDPTEF